MITEVCNPQHTAFGAYLSAQRKAVHMTQIELARATGFSNQYISRVEHGVRHASKLSTLNKFATALGIPLETLMEHTPAYQRRATTIDVESTVPHALLLTYLEATISGIDTESRMDLASEIEDFLTTRARRINASYVPGIK